MRPLATANRAINQPTIQSTTYTSSYSTGGPSKFAADGNTDANWFDGSCISTVGGETWPWWAVDLGANHTIQYVVITKETSQPSKYTSSTPAKLILGTIRLTFDLKAHRLVAAAAEQLFRLLTLGEVQLEQSVSRCVKSMKLS